MEHRLYILNLNMNFDQQHTATCGFFNLPAAPVDQIAFAAAAALN